MALKKCLIILWAGAAGLSAQAPLRQNASPVVMTVDGKDVTAADVQRIIDLGHPNFLKQYQVNPEAAIMNWYVMQHLG